LSFEFATASTTGYATGRDIKGRDEQAKDCRRFIESRSGLYIYTYEEPDTSAYKRRRVVLPDGRAAYRVIRPVFEAALDDRKRGLAPDGQRLDGFDRVRHRLAHPRQPPPGGLYRGCAALRPPYHRHHRHAGSVDGQRSYGCAHCCGHLQQA